MPDDQLRLVFTCCHPSLAVESQVALAQRLLLGLSTEEIARAFLISEPTLAQRLVRAKQKIRDAGVPYAIPERAELPERLEAVAAAVYLVFNEGYLATRGQLARTDDTDWEQIVRLYALLRAKSDSPIVALNEAAAVSMAQGPKAALERVDQLKLDAHHLYWSSRADFLRRLGRSAEALADDRHALPLPAALGNEPRLIEQRRPERAETATASTALAKPVAGTRGPSPSPSGCSPHVRCSSSSCSRCWCRPTSRGSPHSRARWCSAPCPT